jgi:hypothetical protein
MKASVGIPCLLDPRNSRADAIIARGRLNNVDRELTVERSRKRDVSRFDMGAKPLSQFIIRFVVTIAEGIEDADRVDERLVPLDALVPNEKRSLLATYGKTNFVDNVQI